MVQCTITFKENPSGTFYCGSVVNGTVEIILDEPMRVRGVSLVINGRAKVLFNRNRRNLNIIKDEKRLERDKHTFSALEDYLNTITYLHETPDGIIEAGTHKYDFLCNLPPELPSSIESNFGYIRYTAKVIFDRPWKFDKTFTIGFTVLKIVNLNDQDPSIRLPSTLEIQKTFWCWIWRTKPVIMEASIPQSGYVSGQYIPVTVSIFNQSDQTIEDLNIYLKKIVRYTSQSPYKRHKNDRIIIREKKGGPIPNSEKVVKDFILLIPPIPPTSSEDPSRIIQVHYEVWVEAFIRRVYKIPTIQIPITIGNVALSENLNHQSYATGKTQPSAPAINLGASTPDTQLPAPSYEEALYMERVNVNGDELHPISESNYLPKYPVFKFEPSA